MNARNRWRRAGWCMILLGILLRIGVVVWRYRDLSIDTDAYLAIAKNLQDGAGYCSVLGQPTAYRPPLFPCLVALFNGIFGAIGIAILQVCAGAVTLIATRWMTTRLRYSPQQSIVALILVAFDPLLVFYTSQAMTEVLMTSLVTLWLALHWPIVAFRSTPERPLAERKAALIDSPLVGSLASGFMLGLAALCRPTIWPFVVLWAIVSVVWNWYQCKQRRHTCSIRESLRTCIPFATAVILTISPWVIRNLIVIGRPILTTTHGGYTAALGNNDSFYQHVASQPFGTIWPEKHFRDWQDSVEQELAQQKISTQDELNRDRAMTEMATDWICRHFGQFIACAGYRIRNFWSPVPLAAHLPTAVRFGCGAYGIVVALLALKGLVSRHIEPSFRRMVAVLVVSLTLLHSVYWANARMRAPAMPMIAILAAGSLRRMNLAQTN